MLDNLLQQGEDDDSLDDYLLVRSFGPQVQAADGQPMGREWTYAHALFSVARRTLEQHCAPTETQTLAQQQLLTALADVHQHEALTRHDGFIHPYVPGDWFKLQACLGRVLPLVERLLLR